MDRMEQMRWFESHGLTLIKLAVRSKIPIKDENWADELPKRPIQEFKTLNAGVKCGVELEGGYLAVLDIDPRNGGFETLKKMMNGHSLDQTRLVKTPSGGYHYYYISRNPLKKCTLGPGVDFQGVGSYVVIPGSIHPNGKMYVWDMENGVDYVEWLPDWIEELVLEKLSEKKFYDSEDIGDDGKPARLEIGERDDFLISVAGRARLIGLNEEEILHYIKRVNKERCSPPKPEGALKRIAKSARKYEPEPIVIAKPIVDSSQPKKPNQTSRRIVEILEQSSGLVNVLARDVLNAAQRPYEHFALASAVAIVSGIAQGGYSLPTLSKSAKVNDSLSINQWLTAPAGCGKNVYLKAVTSALELVDQRLVASKFASAYGLKASLFCCNAQTAVIDEMQDELRRLSNGSQHTADIITDIKELFNNLGQLKPMITKTSQFPAIKSPRLSLFCAGTKSGFEEHLTGDVISSGFLSRFLVWPYFELTDFSFDSPDKIEFDQEALVAMDDLWARCQTEAGKQQDALDIHRRLVGYLEKGGDPVEHIMQCDPGKTLLGIEDEAAELLRDYRRQTDKILATLVAQADNDNNSAASVVARAPQFAFKLAGIHCVGCLGETIKVDDARFGIELADLLMNELRFSIFGAASESRYEKFMKRVMKVLVERKGKVLKRDIQMVTRNIPGKDLDAILIDLCSSGRVICEAKGAIYNLEGKNLIPRGAQFYLANVAE